MELHPGAYHCRSAPDVGRATTATTIASSELSESDEAVILEAGINSEWPGVPTGHVSFRDGVTLLGSVELGADGVARLAASLAPGTHTVSAIYGGDGRFGPSVATTTYVAQAATMAQLSIRPPD